MKCKIWQTECKRGCKDVCFAKNLYRPSNGSEGMWFTDRFCENCLHDNPAKEKYCELLTASMCLDPTDNGYPTEWIDDDHGVRCTKFVKWDWNNDGDPDDPDNPKRPPPPPDPRQLNLFPLYHPELIPEPALKLSIGT